MDVCAQEARNLRRVGEHMQGGGAEPDDEAGLVQADDSSACLTEGEQRDTGCEEHDGVPIAAALTSSSACHVDALSISRFSVGHSAGDPGRRGRRDGPESQLMSTHVSTTGPLGQPRGIGFAILLAIVTLGIYTLYWVFKTQDEVKEHSGIGVGGVLGLVIYILISPITWFLIPSDVGKMFKADGREAPFTGWTGLWLLLPIIGAFVWFIKIQGALNRYWESKSASVSAPAPAPAAS